MDDIGVSVVLFKSDPNQYLPLIGAILASPRVSTLWLVDHSPQPLAIPVEGSPRVVIIRDPSNPGFGAGHNRALRQSIGRNRYHVLINPDIVMDVDLLSKMARYLDGHSQVGSVMPTLKDRAGKVAHQGRLLPAPWDLVGRRWLPKFWGITRTHYEVHLDDHAEPCDLPNLSGAFLFLRCEALEKVGLFDERFFLYCEDVDLVRRLHQYYRTEILPNLWAIHGHQRASYTNWRMTLVHCHSAILYFMKWGWFHDPQRALFNLVAERRVLHAGPSGSHP